MAQTDTTTAPAEAAVRFPVDTEHGNLRLAVALIFIVLAVFSFFLLAALIPGESINLLAIIGALVLSSALTSVIERQLKQRWPSGREIVVEGRRVAFTHNGKTQDTLTLSGETQLLQWRFVVSRRTRVPKGWLVVAAAVHHIPDDIYMAVYTFMSPEDFEDLPEKNQFTLLQKRQELEGADMRLAGEQRRLHAAENVRWNNGGEMEAEAFMSLVRVLERENYA